MRTEAAQVRVRKIAPPAANRKLSMLGRIDYEDAFVVDVDEPRTYDAEHWLRAILEKAPAHVRFRLLSGWTSIGLKVRVTGSQTLLGWQIRARDADVVLLGADSHIGMPGELLLQRLEHQLLFSTFVRQDNSIARALWASIEGTHVRTVGSLLDQAARRITD